MQKRWRLMMTIASKALVVRTVHRARAWMANPTDGETGLRERIEWLIALRALLRAGNDARRHHNAAIPADAERGVTHWIGPEHRPETTSTGERINRPKSSLFYEYREVTDDEYFADCACFEQVGETQSKMHLITNAPPSAPAIALPPPSGGVVRFPPDGYYESKHWHDHAAAQRRAWGYECALNAAHAGPVEVHHRTYARVGREDERDTIPLCAECHERHHGHMPQPRLLKKAA